jgi:general secretion pathway protein A
MHPSVSQHVCEDPFQYTDFKLALKALLDAFDQGPVYALLLGESGTGKTSLLRALQAELDPTRFRVLYLCHGQPSPSGLARLLAQAFHLPLHRSRAETSSLLVDALRNLPAHPLLWIDEAKMIRDDTLHEIRLLAEADLHGPPLFSVLLSALPELKDRLLSPALFPLWRRISLRLCLTGLLREEVDPFLAHCFQDDILSRFSSEAISSIFELARGIPALVRSFASTCLCSSTDQLITADLVIDLLENSQAF